MRIECFQLVEGIKDDSNCVVEVIWLKFKARDRGFEYRAVPLKEIFLMEPVKSKLNQSEWCSSVQHQNLILYEMLSLQKWNWLIIPSSYFARLNKLEPNNNDVYVVVYCFNGPVLIKKRIFKFEMTTTTMMMMGKKFGMRKNEDDVEHIFGIPFRCLLQW